MVAEGGTEGKGRGEGAKFGHQNLGVSQIFECFHLSEFPGNITSNLSYFGMHMWCRTTRTRMKAKLSPPSRRPIVVSFSTVKYD